MNKEDLFISMDDILKDGIHYPGDNLPIGFNWRLFDSTPGLEGIGTRGRLDHAFYLYRYAYLLPDSSVIVEIGTSGGASAIAMAMGLGANNNNSSKIYTIDPGFLPAEEIEKRSLYKKYGVQKLDLGKVYELIKKVGLENYITIIPDTSENVLKTWNGCIDMIHIDGSHTYEDVKVDCQWLQYIKKGGVAVFDDWFEPVQRAAKEYFDTHHEWELLTDSTAQPQRHPWKTVFWKN